MDQWTNGPMDQSIARGLFLLSRRDREFLPFSLMLRDKIENFFLSVSCFETRSRISSFQSQASRRDREFLSLNLVIRDENENFFYESQTSRRERESRLRQFSREFSGITFIACLLTDIFKKKLLFSQNFLKSYVFFSREI